MGTRGEKAADCQWLHGPHQRRHVVWRMQGLLSAGEIKRGLLQEWRSVLWVAEAQKRVDQRAEEVVSKQLSRAGAGAGERLRQVEVWGRRGWEGGWDHVVRVSCRIWRCSRLQSAGLGEQVQVVGCPALCKIIQVAKCKETVCCPVALPTQPLLAASCQSGHAFPPTAPCPILALPTCCPAYSLLLSLLS